MELNKDETIAIEYKLVEGIKMSDIAFLENVLHDDLLFIAPNGQTITKSMDLASHRAGEMVVAYLVPTFEEIKLFENTASVIVVYDTKGTMQGNPIEGKFKYFRVWQLFDDGLKVIGGSCCRVN